MGYRILSPRPSKLDLHMTCPASLYPEEGEVIVGSEGVAAREGSAVHEVMADRALGKDVDVAKVAAKWCVPADKVSILSWLCTSLWDSIKDFASVWHTEQAVYSTALGFGGTADLLGFASEHDAIIGDWKSGYVTHRMPRHQILSYSSGTFEKYLNLDTITGVAIFPQIGSWDKLDTWDRSYVKEWEVSVKARLYGPQAHETYIVNELCPFCPRTVGCPAKAAILSQASSIAEVDATCLEGQPLKDLLNKISIIQKGCGAILEQIKGRAKVKPIPLGDGTEYAMCQEGAGGEFESTATYAYLLEKYGMDPINLLRVVEFRKKELDAWLGERADEGKKGALIRHVMEELTELGAYIPKTKWMPRTRRITEGE